ncbi:hypothetical protein ACHAQJ_002774 [Trichoderma viride]
MSQASFETPVAQSQHAPQPSFDGTTPNQPGDRGYNTQETWSNAAPVRNFITPSRTKTNPQLPKTRSRGFSLLSLRESVQPELSRKIFRLIKSDNELIHAFEAVGRERISIGSQMSEWGEQTSDEAVSDISDKLGVLISEMGGLMDSYVASLEAARHHLKNIRNIEKSVQPSRDGKSKLFDDFQKLKTKEPQSVKLVMLEQELVRAEAENLVAEAQLTNITRKNFKEAFKIEMDATIERAEKEIILAKHGRRLIELVDDGQVAPGDARAPYENAVQARQVLNDAEDNLKEWQPEYKAVSENGSEQSKGKEVSQEVNTSG